MDKCVRDAFFAESRHASVQALNFEKGTPIANIIRSTQTAVNRATDVYALTISHQLHLDGAQLLDNEDGILITLPCVSEFNEDLYTRVWNDSWDIRTAREWGLFLARGASTDPVAWWADYRPIDDSSSDKISFRRWMELLTGLLKREQPVKKSGDALHSLLAAYNLPLVATREACLEALDDLLVKKRAELVKMNYALGGMKASKIAWEGNVKATVPVKWTVDPAEPEFWADVKVFYNTCTGSPDDWNAFSAKPPTATPSIDALERAVKYIRAITLMDATRQMDDALCTVYASVPEFTEAVERADRRVAYVTTLLRYAEPVIEAAKVANVAVMKEVHSVERSIQTLQTELANLKSEADKLSERIVSERRWAATETRENDALEAKVAAEKTAKRARGDLYDSIGWPEILHDTARRFFREWLDLRIPGADDLVEAWIRGEIEQEDVDRKEMNVQDISAATPVNVRKKTIRALRIDIAYLVKQLYVMPVLPRYRLDLERNLKLKLEYIKYLLATYNADFKTPELRSIKTGLVNIPMYATPFDDLLVMVGQVDPVLRNTLEALPNGVQNWTEDQKIRVLNLRHVQGPVQYKKPQAPTLSGSVKDKVRLINAGAWKPVSNTI